MRFIKVKGVRCLRILNIEGMVAYPFILFASKTPSPELENHEGIHVQQITRDGVLRFYTFYLYEYLKFRSRGLKHDQAYRSISYEKEAYSSHQNLGYKVASRG